MGNCGGTVAFGIAECITGSESVAAHVVALTDHPSFAAGQRGCQRGREVRGVLPRWEFLPTPTIALLGVVAPLRGGLVGWAAGVGGETL
jgi:hypothetical protein